MASISTSRKERERKTRKQEVLEVALTLFADKGFHNVSMQEIAEVTEFSVGTLYNLFENKDGLFDELITNITADVYQDLPKMLDVSGNAAQRIRNFIQHTPDLLEKYATFIKLHVTEFGKSGCKFTKFESEDDFNAVLSALLAEVYKVGMAEGQFRQVDALTTAQSLSAITETLGIEMAGHFNKAEAIEKFSKVEQLFVDALLAV